jgi:hypothetical protein
VAERQSEFINANPIHDIATVYHDGGAISDETHQMMISIMPDAYWEKRFNRYTSDTYAYPVDGDPAYPDYVHLIAQVPTGKLLRLYWDTFVKSPFLLINARLSGSFLIWDYVRLDGTYDTLRIHNPELMLAWARQWGVMNISWKANRLTSFINGFAYFTGSRHPIIHSVFWCIGISNFLVMIALYYWVIKKAYRNILLIIPYILSGLILMVSITAPDIRYIWPQLLGAMIIVYSTIMIEPNVKTKSQP